MYTWWITRCVSGCRSRLKRPLLSGTACTRRRAQDSSSIARAPSQLLRTSLMPARSVGRAATSEAKVDRAAAGVKSRCATAPRHAAFTAGSGCAPRRSMSIPPKPIYLSVYLSISLYIYIYI